MSVTGHGHLIDPDDFSDYCTQWSRCLTEDLTNLFYAYDADNQQTERITSFRISGNALSALDGAIQAAGTDFRLLIHLALKPGYRDVEEIPEKPYFLPIVQVVAKGGAVYAYQNGYAADWNPNPDLPLSTQTQTDSGINEIPGAEAYLFVQAWVETLHLELGDCFESVSYDPYRRVRSYTFSAAESKSIADKITSFGAATAQLSVHLGKGMTVSTHPYAFRPVVEISQLAPGNADLFAKAENGYFDFSQPSPPFPAAGS